MSDTRRNFLKQAAQIGAVGVAEKGLLGAPGGIAIRLDAASHGKPVEWAAGQLREAIEAKGTTVADGGSFVVSVAKATPALGTEAFRLTPQRSGIAVSAADDRGFVYALLELTDRVQYGEHPLSALALREAVEEKPANRIRSIARAFVSEVEDKSWYYDKAFWREYLTTLAAQRFNRFSITFGLGYDFPRRVTGDYLHFPYPYLLEVPGYNVRVVPLPKGERERNLEALRFISEETASRGLQFQLAIWTHAYQWTDSPEAQHRIEGLTPETHGAYCRDAMALLLKTCPGIQGVTMRVHGESGIPEGSLPFWKEVFAGIVAGGRRVELDMHAKGLDLDMLEMAYQTGLPVTISPKYWAEHMGLGYHQADIRELEIPKPGVSDQGTFKLSEGSRRFLRYGYGDLFKKDRRYEVTFRMWPGSQHLLLWGDPGIAAGYGYASHLLGAKGVEICEPLFFKGRQGSGLPGGRCAYLDESLNPKFDFQKYLYTYRIWGRLLYNPQAHPDNWQRYLRAHFGAGTASVEEAITNGSRVLPLFTTARLPSASNLGCWPEMYTNMPIVEGSEPSPYNDTVKPKRLGTVSPLDPQIFSAIEEYTAELMSAKRSGKYSPIEVAQWFEDMAEAANRALSTAAGQVPDRKSGEFRRMDEDVRIETGLAAFFAAQIRSAVLFDLHRKTGDPAALEQAVASYQKGRVAWAAMAERANKVYRADVTFGDAPVRRGHWSNRLPGIDKDLAAMEKLAKDADSAGSAKKASEAVREAMIRPRRESVALIHTPPSAFRPGNAVELSIGLSETATNKRPTAARLYYRHVNHAERWQSIDMEPGKVTYSAAIPTDYTKTDFALQYYFELRREANTAWLYPALELGRGTQPYFVVPQAG